MALVAAGRGRPEQTLRLRWAEPLGGRPEQTLCLRWAGLLGGRPSFWEGSGACAARGGRERHVTAGSGCGAVCAPRLPRCAFPTFFSGASCGVSNCNVTGPSFWMCTCMKAPNSPPAHKTSSEHTQPTCLSTSPVHVKATFSGHARTHARTQHTRTHTHTHTHACVCGGGERGGQWEGCPPTLGSQRHMCMYVCVCVCACV